jgi:SanA protein
VVLAGASLYVEVRYRGRIRPAGEVPAAPVALVFGAGLATVTEPSPLLAERLDMAVALYRAGKVKWLLVSGDSSDPSHDETHAMRKYAMEQGVPEEDVRADDLGLSTYDSCVRAQAVFGVKRAVLVTQRFHLSRALFIANSIGMDADGVAADTGEPRRSPYVWRELLSRPLALAMVIARPEPEGGR